MRAGRQEQQANRESFFARESPGRLFRSLCRHPNRMREKESGIEAGGTGLSTEHTPAILFPRRVQVLRIVSWLPDHVPCSAFSPSSEGNGLRVSSPVLRESPVTVAGPLRNRTAFRVSQNGQLNPPYSTGRPGCQSPCCVWERFQKVGRFTERSISLLRFPSWPAKHVARKRGSYHDFRLKEG